MAARVEAITLSDGSPGYQLVSANGRLQATVAPHDGGGVSSLRWDGRELLYRANQFEPPEPGEWMGRAPLLWPAVGRNFTPAALAAGRTECCFEYQGKVYDLPIHGFTRHRAWEPVGHGADAQAAWVILALEDDQATRAVYPWPFRLVMTHRLEDGGLVTTVAVQSSADLMFGIGNHLTLSIPDAFDDVEVDSNVTCRHLLTDRSLLTDPTVPEEFEDSRSLADTSLHNAVLGCATEEPYFAVIFPDGLVLTVTQEVTHGRECCADEDFLIVLYGNPEKRYFCPEPWIGRPNGLQTGRGVVRLPAGQRFEWVMRLTVGS